MTEADHVFYEPNPNFLSIRSGISTGIGLGFTIEWKDHFESVRDVILWETILVACAAAMFSSWSTYWIFNTIHKIRSPK